MAEMTAEGVLTTTRAVRKRLDLNRPVEREVLEECVRIAQQAPTASNGQNWHFVIVTDAEKRAALAALYRRAWEWYAQQRTAAPNLQFDDPARMATQIRVTESAQYLTDHLHEVPVHLIPCVAGRTEGAPVLAQASIFGSILPAAWSFMLAARARGLGTAWTTLHLMFEEEAAAILEIPYAQVTQTALIPVAYTTGGDFRPGPRAPLATILHWDRW